MIIPYEIVKDGDDNGIEVGKVCGCPFCGKTDKLVITGRKFFNDLVKEHGSAVINIYCKRCDVTLSEYSYNYNGNDYSLKVGLLVSKWNRRV